MPDELTTDMPQSPGEPIESSDSLTLDQFIDPEKMEPEPSGSEIDGVSNDAGTVDSEEEIANLFQLPDESEDSAEPADSADSADKPTEADAEYAQFLVETAVRNGWPLAEAQEFQEMGKLESILVRMLPAQQGDNQESTQPDDTIPGFEPFAEELSDDFDDDLREAWSQMAQHFNKQFETLYQRTQAYEQVLMQQQVEAQTAALNEMLDGAASEYGDIIGRSDSLTPKQQANRARVLDAMGYFYEHANRQGKQVSNDELLRRAVIAEFGEEVSRSKETAFKNRLTSARATRTAPPASRNAGNQSGPLRSISEWEESARADLSMMQGR